MNKGAHNIGPPGTRSLPPRELKTCHVVTYKVYPRTQKLGVWSSVVNFSRKTGGNFLGPRVDFSGPWEDFLGPCVDFLGPWVEFLGLWVDFLGPWVDFLGHHLAVFFGSLGGRLLVPGGQIL